MPHDLELAERIRVLVPQLDLAPNEEMSEIKMFGGLCFAINRKMTVGVGKDRLMIRLGDEDMEGAIAANAVDPMDFTGKPLRNFAYVAEGHYETDEDLLGWMQKSTTFVREHMLGKKK
ncbi:MAG: TfoX/Sxy family protein [Armatimonadetes bacterium]|nr:TfoX/Sxy family protein [Armatimonadota bacterium]